MTTDHHATRRAELLAFIETEKAAGRLVGNIPPHYTTRPVAEALRELRTIDPQAYAASAEDCISATQNQCHTAASLTCGDSQHQHAPHRAPNSTGFSLNGELVVVSEDHVDFDALLGWEEPNTGDEITESNDEDVKKAAELLGDLVRWLANSATLESIGTRAAALVLVLQPSEISRRGSGAEVARRFGLTRQAIQQRTREVYLLAKKAFQARCMTTPDNRTASSKRSREYHARVGHKVRSK
jgi:hypothetical protein